MNYRPKYIEKNPVGRRIAIGDVHGCYFTLKALLNEIQINEDDQVFFLGDLIDRGNNSAKVLELLIKLIKEQFQIYCIKGNHEEKLLTAYQCGFEFFENYLEVYNSQDLLNGELENYLGFINSFEYCIELDDFILSHSGINSGVVTPFTDLRGMFPKINFKIPGFHKIQIHGHVVQTECEIAEKVKNKAKRISIDSGCYLDEEEYGSLTALDLDRMELYHEKRRQQPTI